MEVEDPEDPGSRCPLCGGSTFEGDTIGCAACPRWFHFQCVGVKHGDPVVEKEDEPYYCPDCAKGKPWKMPGNESPKKKKGAARKPKKKRAAPVKSVPIKLKLINKGEGSFATALSAGDRVPSFDPSAFSGLDPSLSKTGKTHSSSGVADDEEAAEGADEDVDFVDPELRSIRDPKLMTARQRAMVSGKNDLDERGLFDAEPAAPPVQEDEEALRQKELKSQRRREVELEKKEQDKMKTVARLLNKKDSKPSKVAGAPTRTPKYQISKLVSYRLSLNGFSISMPLDYTFPFEAQEAASVQPPPVILCAVEGCKNKKKYSCSKTGRPLCSLECYKRNLATVTSPQPSATVIAT